MSRFARSCLKWLAFAIVPAISLSSLLLLNTGQVLAFSGGGSGTNIDPYQITTCLQLQSINASLTSYYVLNNDIDCSDAGTFNGGGGWGPIGGGAGGFKGSLNGQGHKVSNLDLSGASDSAGFVGMFGFLNNSAVVKNLLIINGKVNGGNDIGMVAGGMYSTSSLDNVFVAAMVTCFSVNCGGLVGGLHDTTLINNSGAIVNLTSADQSAGGLVGWIQDNGTVQESYAEGYVHGTNYVGGLVGIQMNTGLGAPATITNAYSSATVVADGDWAGGLVGASDGLALTNAYATGSVMGDDNVGGLVGEFSGHMAEVFTADSITGTGSFVGPVTGVFDSGTVGNRYFDSNITGFSFSPDGSSPISDSDSFMDNSTNPPMSTWNFSTIWRTNYTNYPSFAPKTDPYMLCEEPGSTNTSITGHCGVLPLGWGTPTWQARWSLHDANSWHNLALSDIHLANVTVHGLIPGTWYDLEFRYTNDFGTGPWGKLEILTTGTAPTDSGDVAERAFYNTAYDTPTPTPTADEHSTPTVVHLPVQIVPNKGKTKNLDAANTAYYWFGGGVIVFTAFALYFLIHRKPKA